MNAPTYINSTHRALARNPHGLTLDELCGKLRCKSNKASDQVRELHDLGLIVIEEDAGQPVYRLGTEDAGDSEGGEADAPVDCPVMDPDCLGADSDCHDACEKPAAKPIDWTAPELTYLAHEDYEMPPDNPAWLAAANRDMGKRIEELESWQREVCEEATPGLFIPDAVVLAMQVHHERSAELLSLYLSGEKEINDLRTRLDDVTQQSIADTDALTAQIEHLRAELAAERQAREALQEQSGDAIDVKRAAMGYLVCATKRKPRWINDEERAKFAALAAVRAGAARADVLAVVPVGTARRGAEWRAK